MEIYVWDKCVLENFSEAITGLDSFSRHLSDFGLVLLKNTRYEENIKRTCKNVKFLRLENFPFFYLLLNSVFVVGT